MVGNKQKFNAACLRVKNLRKKLAKLGAGQLECIVNLLLHELFAFLYTNRYSFVKRCVDAKARRFLLLFLIVSMCLSLSQSANNINTALFRFYGLMLHMAF